MYRAMAPGSVAPLACARADAEHAAEFTGIVGQDDAYRNRNQQLLDAGAQAQPWPQPR
jgi:hypothetical protein